MQHVKLFLPLLSLAALVATASAETSPEAACAQLSKALGREVDILTSVQDAAGAEAAVQPLTAVLDELAAMDRSFEAENALWQYIDNTAGVKLPLLELLQRLSVQLARLSANSFYEHQGLRDTLAPQMDAPPRENAGLPPGMAPPAAGKPAAAPPAAK